MINVGLASAALEDLDVSVVVNSRQLHKHVGTVVLGDSPFDWKPVQLGCLTHSDPAHEKSGVVPVR